MGGKTKKKQARKQAATRTKSNGGRNGVSGHMKKSTIGNGKRAAESAESASLLLTKKSSKNSGQKKNTNTKRKRDDADEGADNEDDYPEKSGEDKNEFDALDHRGSSMFTSFDDSNDLQNLSKDVADVATPSGNKDEKRKKRKLNIEPTTASNVAASVFRELVATKLIQLDDSSFSRLLYPNPVCFLTTINPNLTGNDADVHSGENSRNVAFLRNLFSSSGSNIMLRLLI